MITISNGMLSSIWVVCAKLIAILMLESLDGEYPNFYEVGLYFIIGFSAWMAQNSIVKHLYSSSSKL